MRFFIETIIIPLGLAFGTKAKPRGIKPRGIKCAICLTSLYLYVTSVIRKAVKRKFIDVKPMKKTWSVERCLADFFRRFDEKAILMEFAHVSEHTVDTWRNRGVTPKGDHLVRIRHFFELLGYEIDEIKTLCDPAYRVSQCLAFDLVTTEALQKTFGFDRSTHLFNYLRGRSIPKPDRLRTLKKIADDLDPFRLLAIAEKSNQYRKYHIHIPDDDSPLEKDSLIAEFRDVCKKVRELGTELLSGSSKRRFTMRNQMTTNQTPELHLTWEVLNNLLKEETRK